MSVDVVHAGEQHARRHFANPAPVTASITFVGVEPMQVQRFGPDGDGRVHYVTSGCSRYPMVDPTEIVADPLRGPRAEVAVTLRGGVDAVLKPLAVVAAAPMVEGLVLQPDALIDLGEPLWPGAAFTAVLVGPSDIADLVLPEPYDPVRFLTLVPVTATEAAWVRLRGADALREAWREAGIDVTDPARSAVQVR